MKKIWIIILICGISFSVFGQVVSNHTIILNNDTSPLNATIENRSLIYSFKKTDVLTITFKEIKSAISQKSVKITSDSGNNELLIGAFDETDIKDDKSYVLNISFNELKINSEANEVYTLLITDNKGQQNLLRFRLL